MRKLTLILLSVLLIVALVSCGEKACEHSYDNACDVDCNSCGEERAVEHKFADASCTAPKICSLCGATSGNAKGHTWVAADCDSAKACSVCKETDGQPLGHVPNEDDGDCTTAITCKNCSVILTEAKAHEAKADDGDCTTAITCKNCSAILIEAKAHEAKADDGDCTTAVTCKNCSAILTEAKAHDMTKWAYDSVSHWHLCANDGCMYSDKNETVNSPQILYPTVISAMWGVAHDNSENADKLFDGDPNTKWCTYIDSGDVYAILDFGCLVKINSYTMITGNDTADYIGRNWKSWTLFASNDVNIEHSEWAVVHTVSGAELPADNCALSEVFTVNSDTAYRYYKLIVNEFVYSDNGDNVQQMSELTFNASVTSLVGHYGPDDEIGYVKNDDDTHKKICACGYESNEYHEFDENCTCIFCGEVNHDIAGPGSYRPCECIACGEMIHDVDENCNCIRCLNVIHSVDSKTGICDNCNKFASVASVIVGNEKIYCTTFNEAMTVAMEIEDSIIILEDDCKFDIFDFKIENCKITIDINGKTLNSNANYLFHNIKGHLTIKDSVGSGNMVGIVHIGSNGCLVFESGNLGIDDDDSYIIADKDANVKINGGTISSVVINVPNVNIEIKGGTFDEVTCFEDFTLDSFLADGYAYYDENGNVVDTSKVAAEGYWYTINNVTVREIK
jgi:RNase P subunit RPR2